VIYTTRAVVLRNVKYGESSLITDMFTEMKGHQTFIIHSVRKANATTPPSFLQLMSLVEMVAYHQDHKKIHHVKEVRLDHVYSSIPFDMRKSAVITCLAEICAQCITTADPHPELFTFLHDELITYDDPDTYDPDFILRFLAGLSHFLGFGIDLSAAASPSGFFDLLNGHYVELRPLHDYIIPGDDFILLQDILIEDPSTPSKTPITIRRRLVDQLITYYQLHVESLRAVQSIKILRELL
jgi:DNA repair protein RecO (recombination protein O)